MKFWSFIMRRSILSIVLLILPIFSAFSQEVVNLSLEDALKIANQRNPILQMQEKEIDVQKGSYWTDILPENPEIGYVIEGVPKGQSYSNYEVKKLFFKQSFDFPTNYLFHQKILSAKIKQSENQVELYKRELTFLVKRAYFNVLLQENLTKLGAKHLELFEDFYRKSKRSYELGEENRLTMLRSKVNYSTSLKELKSRRKDLLVAISELQELLGMKHYEIEKIVLTDTLPEYVMSFPSEKSMEILKQHPSLRLANNTIRAAANARNLAVGSFLPKFHIAYFKQEINQKDHWGGEIGLSIPLWFLRQKGFVHQKNAELSQAKSSMTAEQLRIRREYDQAVSRFDKAMNEVELYQTELLQEAEEAFRIAQRSYDIGEIGYLDYIDAQQILIHTREGYLESLFSYQVEKANLTSLTGVEF